MDLEYLESVRSDELGLVTQYLTPGLRVLELGAGAGWQARKLADLGMTVEALDVEDCRGDYAAARVWPVKIYDGRSIPFPDDSFDCVFSSNVLEHVEHIDDLEREIARVLAPGGRAIHILPSASWRAWTLASHYAFVPKQAVLMGARKLQGRPAAPPTGKPRSIGWMLREAVWPSPHGEVGNALTEVYHFSRFRWLRHFRRAGWTVEAHFPSTLFYTGHAVLGGLLSLDTRRALSALLGSSCRVYVLKSPSR